MKHRDGVETAVPSNPLYIRKLTKSGATRYLSVGTILPPEWVEVKVVVEEQSNRGVLLRIEPIR